MQNPGGPGPNDTRNVIIAIVLSALILLGFEFFYNAPLRREQAQERARAEEQVRPQPGQAGADAEPGQTPSAGPVPREQILGASAEARIAIDTGAVDGSISLEGARIDDLNLRDYRRTVDPQSPEVTVLSPMGADYGHDAFFGWETQRGQDVATMADAFSRWQAPAEARLTPQTPVTLTLQAGEGRTIERTIAIDENFMFTITDVVRNETGAPFSVRPFGTVRRQGMPEGFRFNQIVHQGLIGVVGNRLRQTTYRDADKHARDRVRERVGEDERIEQLQGEGSWFGITDHYWLTAIVPPSNESVSVYFDARAQDGGNDYRSAYRGEWRQVPAGGSITYTQRLFSGAKRYQLLRDYQRDLDIPKFDDAIDWGIFYILTRPFFAMLHWFGQLFAGWGVIFNFGLAILASTVVIKLLLFPLVYQSFKAMAKMRGLAPKMKELQERYAADKQRQQQELLKLYQTEKINPVSGCVPILLQIPVFYALYKTLTVTLEMRHAPFVGWIDDLSARDPTSIFNLFGLLPFEVSPTFFAGALIIGVWPILYGVSMWALQALSPPPTDPVQAQIFKLLPILFTFMFAGFPAGLVIYWTWSNTLSILQQYVIMRRQGVETQLDKWLKNRFGKGDDDGSSGHKREAATVK
ncbi:MAG TPA: membrane protein insertase YidC [Vitreimonas sp.]|uniref:membrane protein insertase YidC n=1 Tax=Vitreimonas sp. TaxID=3069702 RepID=UPI002D4F4D84|nr:membrane protein insertase YidC [Vitreimonas sp.]HYD87091.1 membrane protein insertase YidC [Vitreimonas sp.]